MDIKYTSLADALSAVSKNGLDIKYCAPELISNIEVLKVAIRQNYYALREIRSIRIPNTDELIINNKELMFELIKIDARVFRDLGLKLKDDEDLVLYTVERYGSVLKDASKRLQNNKTILLKALNNTIYSLDGARIDEELKNDKEVALTILKYKHNRLNIKWFGNKLKQEIIDGVGYDVTLEPLNQTVIEHVKSYLKCSIEGKEFAKPKCPFKIEPKIENKVEEQKVQTKIEEPKMQTKVENNIKKEEIKTETKIEIETKKEENLNIENYITEELKKLNELSLLVHKLQEGINESNSIIKKEQEKINLFEKELNEVKEELNKHVNSTKTLVLELRK